METTQKQEKVIRLLRANNKFDLANILFVPLFNFLSDLRREKFYSLKMIIDGLRFQTLCIKSLFVNNTFKSFHHVDVIFSVTEKSHYIQAISVIKVLEKIHIRFLILSFREEFLTFIQKDGYPVISHTEIPYRRSNFSFFFDKKGLAVNTSSEGLSPKMMIEFFNLRRRKVKYIWGQLGFLLTELKPKVIVTGNDQSWENRCLVLIASNMKLKTVWMQHGSISIEPFNAMFISDSLLVYGRKPKEMLVQSGLDESRIVITGAPYLDELLDIDFETPNEIILERILPDKRPFVLIALSGVGKSTSLKHYKLLAHCIVRLMQEHSETFFIIKFHRKDKNTLFQDLINQNSLKNVALIKKPDPSLPANIFEWFRGCSLVISGASTIIFEAVIAGVSVVSLDLMNEYSSFPFLKERVIQKVNDYDALNDLFLNILNQTKPHSDEERISFVNSYFHNLDKQATQRVASFITNEITQI